LTKELALYLFVDVSEPILRFVSIRFHLLNSGLQFGCPVFRRSQLNRQLMCQRESSIVFSLRYIRRLLYQSQNCAAGLIHSIGLAALR